MKSVRHICNNYFFKTKKSESEISGSKWCTWTPGLFNSRCLKQVLCEPFAGEEHNCEPHLQDWQSAPRAGLLPQTLQPAGLCGTVPEDETASLQQASGWPAVPSTGPAVDDGSLPAATDATLSILGRIIWVTTLEGRLLFFFFPFVGCQYMYDWLKMKGGEKC